MKSNVIPMTQTHAYAAAREQATRLEEERSKLDQEIAAIDAKRHKAQTENTWLAAGLSALAGAAPDAPELAELTRRRDAIASAITPAHMAVHDAVRDVSREYYKTRVASVVEAMDGLILALDGVVVACETFQTIRETGESLGYNAEASGLPIAVEKKYSEWVKANLPGLKHDADRLRDSIDPSLDDAVVTVLALSNINIYGVNLKIGETGEVSARYARELIRSGSAEETTPGRARMSKLKNLIGR